MHARAGRKKAAAAGGYAGLALLVLWGFCATAAPAGAERGRAPAGAAGGRLLQHVAVFGADDRIGLPAKYRELQEKLGLLFNLRSRTVCTAFCVAPDLVATAGHCLHRTAGERPPRLADFWFARNYDTVRDYARIAGHASGAAAQHVMSGAFSLSVRPPIDATRDWALVRLARPVCSKGVLALRVLPTEQILAEAAAKRVFQVSYHRDFTPWKLAYSRPCSVARSFDSADWSTIAQDFADPSQLLLHLCDTGGASSGSPLLLETARGPEVIGINVGTYVQSKVLMQEGQVTKRLKADTVANTAVSIAVLAGKVDTFRQAAILNSPALVKELQTALKQRQLFAGAVDGAYGAALKTAIEAYERAQGLAVTGLPTQGLLRRLVPAGAERRKSAGQGKS